MKSRSVLTLCVLSLFSASVGFAATCPGSVVSVNLTSPTSGTYAIPIHFQATASSSGGSITGYAVYTNQYADIPFATGQPMYLNGIATLNSWVMLPETGAGGALSQTVFVRAWDSAGNCGDSGNLSITASGAVIPNSFPSGYQQWLNREDDQENSNSGNAAGWWDCGTPSCSGGANTATVSFAFGQSPKRDTNGSIALSVTGPDYANGLFWYKVPPIGQQDSLQNFVWDFYFYLSSSTTTINTQAVEFDLFQAKGGYKYMIGTQCNYHPDGGGEPIWDAWDQSSGRWVPAVRNTQTESNPSPANAIACPAFSTGTWHHAQFYLQRTLPDAQYPQGRILYGTVSIDGSATVWDISAPAASSTWGDVLGINHQLDTFNETGTVTLQEFVDADNITAWPQD